MPSAPCDNRSNGCAGQRRKFVRPLFEAFHFFLLGGGGRSPSEEMKSKLIYGDARKIAISKGQEGDYNTWKTAPIDYEADVPEAAKNRAEKTFQRLSHHLGKYKTLPFLGSLPSPLFKIHSKKPVSSPKFTFQHTPFVLLAFPSAAYSLP